MVAWDVLIGEGALYADFAALSSTAHPNLLFRWGRDAGGSVYDSAFAVGPLAHAGLALRVMHLLAATILIAIALRTRRDRES